jgi:hypothetical protein
MGKLQKIEVAFVICLLFGPVLLERFGIISGNWRTDLQELLLVIAASFSVMAVYRLDKLEKEIQHLKGE